MEIARQHIIKRLQDEGLMNLNKEEKLPLVCQKIAIISSPKAAGYQDFIKQLANNPYGYGFQTDLFEASVQGTKVETETVKAIKKIVEENKHDLAVIVRGGGSKLDLSGYDNYNIASAISTSAIPFIIGIGHDIDSTIVDMVSFQSLKTPTAVADYLVEHNANFEYRFQDLIKSIFDYSLNQCFQARQFLSDLSNQLLYQANSILTDKDNELKQNLEQLKIATSATISNQDHILDTLVLKVEGLNPFEILKKGYAYVERDSVQIKSIADVNPDDLVQVSFHDGKIEATVKTKT